MAGTILPARDSPWVMTIMTVTTGTATIMATTITGMTGQISIRALPREPWNIGTN